MSVPLKGEKQRLVIRHDKGFGFKGIAGFICQQQIEPRIIRNQRERAVCGGYRCGQTDFGSLNREPDFAPFIVSKPMNCAESRLIRSIVAVIGNKFARLLVVYIDRPSK